MDKYRVLLALEDHQIMSFSISASQLDQIKSSLLTQAYHYHDVLTTKLLPLLNTKSKTKYIATAVTLYILAKVYNTIAYPRNLRHIKRVSALAWMNSLMTRESHLQREEKYIIPTWKDTNGFVSIYTQFGWVVNVTNPEAVRTIFYKTGNDYKDSSYYSNLS
jgi:hypothetical protein